LKKGDLVLMWNKRDEKPEKHGKFCKSWLFPCRIEDIVGLNSFSLGHLDEERLSLSTNGLVLNLYFSSA
jgi:hypothetical protein